MAGKFNIPTVQPWTVVRQRLLQTISQGVCGPLTLVSAPAGSGKTVLASSWIAAGLAPGPVAWVSLDEEDSQPGQFWSYILAALAHTGLPVSGVGLPEETGAVDHSLLIRLAACLSERSQPVVLVLDNAQVLGGHAVPEAIDFLIQHAGPQLRVVILTRTDLSLPLHRYRVAASVIEIRPDQLAFTRSEVPVLLRAHGADLPESAVSALAEKTQGWAASLRLAALALQHGADPGEPGYPDGAATEIADYFVAEVLNAQPAGIRDFLLRTSVVDRLWPALATELTGRRDATRTLAGLAHANTFLSSSPEGRGSYQYHPLIRDLLRAQLRDEFPGRVGQLHRRAASWLADEGRLADATGHAVAAGDWEFAAALVVDDLAIGRLLTSPNGRGFAGMFAGMPPDVAGPEAAVTHAALALARQDTDAGAKHLLRAHELLGDGPPDRTWALHLAIAATDVVCAGARGDTESALIAAADAETILSDATAHGIEVPACLSALILSSKGAVLLHAGELDDARAVLADGLRAADGPGCDYLRVVCLGQLALIEALKGRLRRSAEFARRAQSTSDRFDLPVRERPPAADVALAWVHAEEYDLATARTHADRAAANSAIRADAVAAGMLAVVRTRLQRARSGAVVTMDRAHVTDTVLDVPCWLIRMLATCAAAAPTAGGASEAAVASMPVDQAPDSPRHGLLLASAKLATGAADEASGMVAEVLRQANLPLDVQVDAWLLTATCELTEGRTDLARGAVEHALGLASAERLRRPVMEASPRLRRFLRQERGLSKRHSWLGAAVIGMPEARIAAPRVAGTTELIIEPLTDKETEVLRYLAAFLSTEEIARNMFVSVNTVKTHVRGVLRKLAASRRHEAIRRARELDLI